MSDQFQIRRDTLANLQAATPAQGELAMATDTDELYVGDGVTPGGIRLGPSWPFANYVSGRYYCCGLPGTGTLTVVANLLYAMPFFVFRRQTFTKIGAEITAAAGTNFRLGIFSDSNVTPANLIIDSGNLAAGVTGIKEATISWTPNPGLYHLGAIFDNTPTVRQGQAAFNINTWLLGSSVENNSADSYYSATQAFGALPSTFPAGSFQATNSFPLVWLRL